MNGRGAVWIGAAVLLVLAGCSEEGSGGSTPCSGANCAGSGALGHGGGTSGGGPDLGPIAGADSSNEGGGSGCISESIAFDTQPPNVMLLVDTSASMIIPDIDGESRWQALDDALFGADGMVPELEDEMRFGLTLYASAKPAGTPASEQMCPFLQEEPLALGNGARLAKLFRATTPRGTTPTGDSLDRTWRALSALPAEEVAGPRIIVLATDGEPTLCGSTDEPEAARQLAVTAVRDAFAHSIETFVVAVGNELGEDHLRELANWGQGFPGSDPTNRSYRVLDAGAIADAFRAIAQRARSCDFELHGVVPAGDAGRGSVRLDGEPLAYQDPDGWVLVGQSQVTLQGAACEAIRTGATSLDIRFPCGIVVPK